MIARCQCCRRPRFLSRLGSVCPASDPTDPGFHDFAPFPLLGLTESEEARPSSLSVSPPHPMRSN